MPRIVAQSRLHCFFLIHCVLCKLNAMRWKLRPRSEQGMSSSRCRSLSRGSTIRFRNEQTIWIPIYGRGSDGWDFPRRGFMRKIHFCSDFSLFSWDFDLILTCGGMNEKVVIQMNESLHMTCGSQVMKCTILIYLHTLKVNCGPAMVLWLNLITSWQRLVLLCLLQSRDRWSVILAF